MRHVMKRRIYTSNIYVEYKFNVASSINKFDRINASDVAVHIESHMKIEETKRETCRVNHGK